MSRTRDKDSNDQLETLATLNWIVLTRNEEGSDDGGYESPATA